MADKKTESGKEPVQEKPAKATTGAWWKSTVQEEVVEKTSEPTEQASSSTDKGEGDIPPPSEKTPRKKPATRPRGRRKKSTPVKEESSSVMPTDDKPKMTKDTETAVKSVVVSEVPESVPGDESAAGQKKVESTEGRKQESKAPRSRGKRKQKPKEEGREERGPQSQPSSEPETEEIPPVLKLLINAEEPEECRLALLADGRLESIHVSTVSSKQTKNNIYKAKIVAIESSLQAAFVDYGTEKNGFLPFNEIHPEYYKQEISQKNKQLIEQHQWTKLNITDVLERGQEVLVQVVKEEVGNKGANMTTYLSIPGRCVVLMPGSDSTGISRKISGEERRSQLREIITSLGIPEGIGWIVRTASVDITKTALSRDVRYLLNLWKEIKAKGQSLEGVGLVYQDHDCVLRFLREHFDPDIKEILVDDLAALEKVNDFLELLPSKQKGAKARLHKGARPIFNQYNVEDQIESIYQPQVALPSGGSIVIDPTEALVAIDVNSGSTGKGQNFEDSIFKANMEAASELARQLRLRDLGGLIVVDFIDMRSSKNIRAVERQVKNAMKRDRAKVDISRISKFGLMQISRQKLGAPIEAGNYRVCEHCKGRGMVRSIETLALFYLRRIQTGASKKEVLRVECRLPLDVAQYLLNNKRSEISEMEVRNKISIVIVADPTLKPADHEIIFHKQEKVTGGRK
ncbi:MAG: Rne/Rng family ribonuclease [Proteobacteria bacterium]|nr:Rne/Rng family ribonuclease [Pseudomonadota bacterium]MBU1233404.1 Rne/Rng family ribonuclease [Pseudomonadota bacterium]MBU1417279.1 Rne/Rng family ribonuclease [Pseudomonadota bacterium]MBU1453978.1 Rne/Rng family ribonuclease [Pseudomonadota bacterium]